MICARLDVFLHLSPNWIIDALLDATRSMSHLQELRLKCFFDSVSSDRPIPFYKLPPLRKLRVIIRLPFTTGELFADLGSWFNKISDPVQLELAAIPRNSTSFTHNDIPVLDDLLPEPGRGSLKVLKLIDSDARLTPSIIMHLRSLTSLFLWGTHPPVPGFWKALHRERIFLQCLHTSFPDEHLVPYLASFSGLRELDLRIGTYKTISQLLDADRFFEEVLPRHASTLRMLRIIPINQDNWSFNAARLTSIMECTQLVDLGLSVRNSESRESSAANGNIVVRLHLMNLWSITRLMHF